MKLLQISCIPVFIGVFPGLFITAAVLAAPPLFSTPTRTEWQVKSGSKAVASIVLLTDGMRARVEWKSSPSAAPTVFLATDQKLWARNPGSDLALADFKGTVEKTVAPALLLPVTTSAKDPVELKGGKVVSYTYKMAGASVKSVYHYDAKGIVSIEVSAGAKTYELKRVSSAKGGSDPALYVVHSKKGAGEKISKLAGNLFGQSDTSVSVSAGTRGAGKEGLKLDDGGDYDALAALEKRDDQWTAKLPAALKEFQKEGNVGQERGN
jgi:hypothetical protein